VLATTRPAVQYVDRPFDWAQCPLWFHTAGRQETATGYGRRLRSTRMIRFHGEKVWRRVYVCLISNAGTAYILIGGTWRVLRDFDFEPAREVER